MKLKYFKVRVIELNFFFQVPPPLWWEYIWCVSVLLSFLGLSAAKGNRLMDMQKYMGGLVLLGVFPLFYCLIYYFRDSIDYITLEEGVDVEDTDIFMWQVRISVFNFK